MKDSLDKGIDTTPLFKFWFRFLRNKKFRDLYLSGQLGTGMCLVALDIFSYAGSTLKSSLSNSSEDKNGSGSVRAAVHLWRSTAAINRLDLFVFGAQFNVGTTVTLYGIKAA
jgi:hypothetical protein